MKCFFITQQFPTLTGGGNSFLKALQKEFISKDLYINDPAKAQFFLMNSHHDVKQILQLKQKYPRHLFFHRIDGPMKCYNKKQDRRDDIVRLVNYYIADATIFQSKWSQKENQILNNTSTSYATIIHNAPDPDVFNRKKRSYYSKENKTHLLASSWSSNWQKGFKTLEWLDHHLDFNQFDMTFVGNSPITFKNINHKQPVKKVEMASLLKKSDIYIFASNIEACSNALLEALHCGVPVIAANSSSNPEIIQRGGELFDSPPEIPSKIEKILHNYTSYQNSIQNESLSKVGDRYYSFMKDCFNEIKHSKKRLNALQRIHIRSVVLARKIIGKIESFKK